MLTQHIALVPETADAWHESLRSSTAELLRVSAALQRQVSHDLGPLWGVQATVNVFAALEEVPVGYWPIIVRASELGSGAGVHLDEHGQPYARVAQGPLWSLAASRACLEMLVNPFGDRCVSAPSPRVGQTTVEVLLEVCGPCAAPSLAYPIDGIMVSDFCLPNFFTSGARDARERLSFRHSLQAPFEPHLGGHLTWRDPVSNMWWLRRQIAEGALDVNLGPVDRRLTSARALVQQQLLSALKLSLPAHVEHDARTAHEHAEGAARARAQRLRSLLGPANVYHARNEALDDDPHEEISEFEEALFPAIETSTFGSRAGGGASAQGLASATAEAPHDSAPEAELAAASENAEQFYSDDDVLEAEAEAETEAEAEAEEAEEEDEAADPDISDEDVREAVESVSYDTASDVLTESVPPPLPQAQREPRTPVPPLPSVPPPFFARAPEGALRPAKPRASTSQLSALSERKESNRGGVVGIGLASAAVLVAIWFASGTPENKLEPKPATQAAAEPKPSAPLAPAPVASAPVPTAQAQHAEAKPGEATGASGAPAPKAVVAQAPTAPTAPTVKDEAQAEEAAGRRRARRERLAAKQASAAELAPPTAPAQGVAASSAPAPSTPSVEPAPAAANTRTVANSGIEDLIESRQ